jgi:hypothetical protein
MAEEIWDAATGLSQRRGPEQTLMLLLQPNYMLYKMPYVEQAGWSYRILSLDGTRHHGDLVKNIPGYPAYIYRPAGFPRNIFTVPLDKLDWDAAKKIWMMISQTSISKRLNWEPILH